MKNNSPQSLLNQLDNLIEKHNQADADDRATMQNWRNLVVREIQKQELSDNNAFKSFIFTLKNNIESINHALLYEENLTEVDRKLLLLRRGWCEDTLKPFLKADFMDRLEKEIKEAVKAIDNENA